MTKQNTRRGFTLIELLVVVFMIGIVAAVAVPQYQKAVDKARFTELITLVRHVKDMQEVYYLANGTYAADCEELGVDIPGGYELNADKHLVEPNKDYVIACDWGGRVSGQVKNNGTNLLAYERRFDHVETDPGRQSCWSNNEERYKKLCQFVCGKEVEEKFSGDKPNGFGCTF